MPSFTLQKGYGRSGEFEINKNQIMIGRGSGCDIVLDKGEVSRRHAKVTKKNQNFFIEDMDSSNGTFVNSAPIAKPYELKHLDVVQIGKNVLMFNDIDRNTRMERTGAFDGQKTGEYYTFGFLKHLVKQIETNIGKVIKGKPDVIRNLIICLLADGHILIEDAPGVGKSVLGQALAKSIRGTYRRIQFTPDMLPSDITGVSVYDDKSREFRFIPGPIFGNIILADEINRTTPRTQSSLLECMSESVISIDGETHVLPKPFFVIATQNPSDYHGTYPLPEPQLDRFLMRTSVGYPDPQAEREILDSQIHHHPLSEISYVVNAMDIVQCQALIRKIHIAEPVRDYIVKIAEATRKHPALATAASPRASLALMRVSQSLAAYYERDYVIPRDVRELVVPVLAHRISLKLRSQGEWENAGDVLRDIMASVPMENEEIKT